ncbi:GIY-YIG nuclease family protein [Halomonas sp. PR-M31]|uniref:GIY-YIG nuclease family protein n=1 Tax=Halomonas sp. PR-M31 TaxID=1471202 RepID=UPI000651B583|nr:GIY-YIG nuclease family protein [Halomonas sp. PR-M31]
MTQGRSIRLFLVDGTPNGLLTAEIMNWIGHVLTGPRSKLSELVQRPECGRTGIYFLVGPDPENSLRPLVYIGESDDVSTRLKQHNRPEVAGPGGGKDFWERVCLITSKDQNLTKAHVKYLESLLIKNAADVGRCKLINGTAHEYINLPESDRADMAFFAEQIRTVLPVLGFDFLRGRPTPASQQLAQTPEALPQSPRFTLEVPRHGIKAMGQEVDGEFFVFKGSLARGSWVGTERGYQSLYNQLCEDGVLVESDGTRIFNEDQSFSSPSAAAAVVSGRSANGRISWKAEGSGMTYGEWQDQQVSAAAAQPEATEPTW